MPQLSDERRKLYERLEAQVRDTPLYEITHIEVPRKCRIFCKEEYRNPTGSHYDRQTVKLLRGFEEDLGRITPNGTPLAETTTGSSGASFAWMCRVLGYKCIVFIPGDMPSARIEQIKSFEADVRFAPNRGYIRGLVRAFSTFISEGREQFIATNHSKDVEYAPAAMGDAGREILRDLKRLKLDTPDYFVAALGNGISARGIGEVLAAAGTTLIGMEPQESPDVLHSVFPERFKRLYPEGHPTTQHELYGTGPGEDASIQFPNIDVIKERLSDIRLPSRNQWQAVQRELSDIEGKHVGNSSAACLWSALDLANDPETPPESTIVTVFYDASWRYLPISPGTPPLGRASGSVRVTVLIAKAKSGLTDDPCAKSMDYFRLCVRYQDPSAKGEQEQRGILNNSDQHYLTPELQWADDWKKLLSIYLRAKFAYLESLQRDAPATDEEIADRLGVSHCAADLAEGLEEVEDFWRRMAAPETLGLLLRLEQLPPDVVTHEWYVDCQEFRSWADAAQQRHSASAEQGWRDLYSGDYRRLLNEHPGATNESEERDVLGWRAVTDVVYSGANELADAVSGHILGFRDLPSEVTIELGHGGEMVLRGGRSGRRPTIAPGRLVADVSTMLLKEYGLAGKPRPSPTELMYAFTVAVATATDCAFCDFLVWEDDVLRPKANSSPNADLAALMRLPYRRGEGISGSAVLLPRDAARRWVGTNDLSNDPRGSLRHAVAYQRGIGGPISDYWLFPIFGDGRAPLGAFRVVNRASERHRAGVPWSPAILTELHSLAIWFESELLPYMNGLSGNDRQRLARHASEAAHGGAIQVLRSGCDMDWIDRDFFAELVAHMCSVAFRRVEKTSLGCCIGIFEKRDFAAVVDLLQNYKAVAVSDVADLEAASALYPRVSPSAGMFVYGQHGGAGRIVSLQGRSSGSPMHRSEELTRDRERAAIFILERGQDCVRIVAHGDVIADYYISDTAGTWTPRIYEPLLQVVLSSQPPGFHENTVRDVFRLATDLSYMRIGAMAILTDELPSEVSLVGGDNYSHLILENLSRDVEAADLARVDGAIQINSSGAVTRCGAFVRRNVPLSEQPDRLGAAGSRHRAGEDLSTLAPDALIFVVSENRPLTVFKGGSKVLDGV